MGGSPKLRNGRVKPKTTLKWSKKSPEAQKGSKKLSGRSPKRCRKSSETVREEPSPGAALKDAAQKGSETV